jgi:hypothetical protein
MCSSPSKITSLAIAAAVGIVLGMPRVSQAQSEPAVTNDQSHRVSIAYIPPSNSALQAQYDVLKDHRALEQIQEILSPLHWPEELTSRRWNAGW